MNYPKNLSTIAAVALNEQQPTAQQPADLSAIAAVALNKQQPDTGEEEHVGPYITQPQMNSPRTNHNMVNERALSNFEQTFGQNNENKKLITFYEENIIYYYDIQLIKKLLEKYILFSDLNELSYEYIRDYNIENEQDKIKNKKQIIDHQNQLIVRSLESIFNIAKKETTKKTEKEEMMKAETKEEQQASEQQKAEEAAAMVADNKHLNKYYQFMQQVLLQVQ